MQIFVRPVVRCVSVLAPLAFASAAIAPAFAAEASPPTAATAATTEAVPSAASTAAAPAAVSPPATTETPKADATAPASAPAASTTTAPQAVGAGFINAAAPPSVAADPIVVLVRQKLGDASLAPKADKDDVAAAVGFYGALNGPPLWVEKSGFTAKGKAAIGEIRKADDWGLQASAFDLPTLADGQASDEALAQAEAKLSLELLKYVRFAKGGRVNPASLSRILDVVPPVKDPKVVMAELAQTPAPDAYLRDQHPKHEQFVRLHEVLLKARGPAPSEEPIDEALKVKLPQGKTIKVGADQPDVALLRKRLKVPAADGAKETLFDDKLAEAVKDYQTKNGLKATGQLSGATRTALNREGEPKSADPESKTMLILINMERWRWLPENLGDLYVWNNIPEYITRVRKGKEEIFKEKIIVGQPAWATPVFSADMQFIIFNPSWGVPDGIKTRELLPRLRSASGGFFFFGGGGGGQIIRAYGFNVYRGGKQIDPDSVDWGTADMRDYSFVQPPGGKNPLGFVKFRFPNKHDVYMHDTVERELFAQSSRALSHGCIRVQNPRRLAEVLLGAGNGWSPEKVGSAISSGGDITLEKPIPVHLTYFTAVVDDAGKMSTFGDIYGHDSRLTAALTGKVLKLDPVIETSSVAPDDGDSSTAPASGSKQKKGKKKNYSAADDLADAISGLLSN